LSTNSSFLSPPLARRRRLLTRYHLCCLRAGYLPSRRLQHHTLLQQHRLNYRRYLNAPSLYRTTRAPFLRLLPPNYHYRRLSAYHPTDAAAHWRTLRRALGALPRRARSSPTAVAAPALHGSETAPCGAAARGWGQAVCHRYAFIHAEFPGLHLMDSCRALRPQPLPAYLAGDDHLPLYRRRAARCHVASGASMGIFFARSCKSTLDGRRWQPLASSPAPAELQRATTRACGRWRAAAIRLSAVEGHFLPRLTS